jgi:hypothetical protein
MIRLTNLVNKIILTKNTDTLVDRVKGIFIHPTKLEVVAVSLKDSLPFTDVVLEWPLIRRIDDLAIWIDSEHDLTQASLILKPLSVIHLSGSLKYRYIRTHRDSHPAQLTDLMLYSSGAVTGIEVNLEEYQDPWLIPITDLIGFGHRHIYVSDRIGHALIPQKESKEYVTPTLPSTTYPMYRQAV